MVLWEITLGTAYFLGLRRTYRLVLRIQRRLIGPNHPRIRQFVHRRTRTVFDVAVSAHKKIQERDIEVGRNLSNWIFRWLDRVKPSAEIRPPFGKLPVSNSSIPNQMKSPNSILGSQRFIFKNTEPEKKGKLFFAPLNIRPKSFPSIAIMMQQMRPTGMNCQYRHVSGYTANASSLDSKMGRFGSVFRQDIAQWMLA